MDYHQIFNDYLQSIATKYSHPETSEMGYRSDFEQLLKQIFSEINVKRIDHDAKAQDGNKPDFVVLQYDIPILYIEAKDIGTNLDKIEKSTQMSRYFGYDNLILTDYVEYRFYRNGIAYNDPIKIAEVDTKTRIITDIPDNFENLTRSMLDFVSSHKEPIKSGKHLAKIMGGKAQRIRDNIRRYIFQDSQKNAELIKIYETFRKLLVQDLSKESFADMYAQTLVYGLFVARFHDNSPDDFTRQEARERIPKSNPLLRHFFDHIAGPDFDDRLEYIVNELCAVFAHADVKVLMNEYYKTDLWGKDRLEPDPVIHFYEDFLREYDPDMRKKMGAFYTPVPVVQFIVRSVDQILKHDFGLAGGLADTSKLENGKHKVQILDPAVGTGTFISKIIRNIYEQLKNNGQIGRWHPYVLHDLLPRLHGFELMMAPYTIAHLKLSMAFADTGFKYFNDRRLGIYLTNSLEDYTFDQTLFSVFGLADSIAQESEQAGKIKNDTSIMIVIGNPPYSVSSSNKGKWITDLCKVYKENLDERNIQPLSDDYIKFIRFGEHFIEKNKTGIVAMITNNSFIDGIIHRQMRKHLLDTFDDIYILDLHGNSKKKETAPDGGKDWNVFDIQQGVSINIMVRKNVEKKELGNVYHADLYGKREDKFHSLNENNIESIKWQKLSPSNPYYFFVPKDFGFEAEYNKGFKVDELFIKRKAGIATAKDTFIVKNSVEDILDLKNNITELSVKELSNKYKCDESKIIEVKKDIDNLVNEYTPISYRPFDIRFTLYSPSSNGLIQRPRYEIMKHMLKPNISLLLTSMNRQLSVGYCFVSELISDRHNLDTAGDSMSIFPLYLYHDDGSKTPNLNQEIVNKIKEIVGEVTPENIFDYIYAVLHSPSYREKYKEFLKIDFPRVPYPRDQEQFDRLVEFGSQLRQLHLLEIDKVNQFITTYPINGDDVVEKVKFEDGKVFINETQYFGNVPTVVWNFYIGGYQPAQKWLKDRKGRTLTNEDLEHYQKMIVALFETDKLMQEIDRIEIC